MAFHDHEMSFESFTDHHHHHQQQQHHHHHHQHQQQQRLSGAVVDVSSGGGGSGAPTWLSNAILRQQSSNNNNNNSSSSVLHDGNDDVHAGSTNHRGGGGGDRNRTESEDCEREERWEWESAKYKGDIVTHPLYEQLLSAHVACLRIATPVDQLPKIDAQLEQSQRVVAKYSVLGNGAVDQKELDQFMVSSVFFLLVICLVTLFLVIAVLKKVDFFCVEVVCCLGFYVSPFLC